MAPRVSTCKPLTLTTSKASTLTHDEDPAGSQAREVELERSGAYDHERPLNTRGRQDAPRMVALVREYGLIPDVVISSDAVRLG
jgi:phosphohistidine phosphatase SixA